MTAPPERKWRSKLPALPKLLERKLYKTGQTRGADDDEIFQNRVLRCSTALVPYACWNLAFRLPDGDASFDNGYIALISPSWYFATSERVTISALRQNGLKIGQNALIFYETREQWKETPVLPTWKHATSRTSPLGGQYVARIPGTTSKGGGRIRHGYERKPQGAGIRIYEYASSDTIAQCRDQLEALVWSCHDACSVMTTRGMTATDANVRKDAVLASALARNLFDTARLLDARIINDDGETTCPLCLEPISADGFFGRVEQAEGRIVPDLTITHLNLFHIDELKYGAYNHRPYNLGWGHHHCNVVVKDSGIAETLTWMKSVLERNTTRARP